MLALFYTILLGTHMLVNGVISQFTGYQQYNKIRKWECHGELFGESLEITRSNPVDYDKDLPFGKSLPRSAKENVTVTPFSVTSPCCNQGFSLPFLGLKLQLLGYCCIKSSHYYVM